MSAVLQVIIFVLRFNGRNPFLGSTSNGHWEIILAVLCLVVLVGGDYLRISQLGPTHPGRQWQEKPFDWSTQVPPW